MLHSINNQSNINQIEYTQGTTLSNASSSDTTNPWEQALEELFKEMGDLTDPKARDAIMKEIQSLKQLVDGPGSSSPFSGHFDTLYSDYVKFYNDPTNPDLKKTVQKDLHAIQADTPPAAPSTPLSREFKKELSKIIQDVLLPLLGQDSKDFNKFQAALRIFKDFGALMTPALQQDLTQIEQDYNTYMQDPTNNWQYREMTEIALAQLSIALESPY